MFGQKITNQNNDVLICKITYSSGKTEKERQNIVLHAQCERSNAHMAAPSVPAGSYALKRTPEN